MIMPGREFSSGGYRFGFNGKENDDEVKGVAGSQQDYGMRIYDARLGRFLSVDPIANDYPQLTPYQFASNTPIRAIDLDGLEAYVKPDAPGPYQFFEYHTGDNLYSSPAKNADFGKPIVKVQDNRTVSEKISSMAEKMDRAVVGSHEDHSFEGGGDAANSGYTSRSDFEALAKGSDKITDAARATAIGAAVVGAEPVALVAVSVATISSAIGTTIKVGLDYSEGKIIQGTATGLVELGSNIAGDKVGQLISDPIRRIASDVAIDYAADKWNDVGQKYMDENDNCDDSCQQEN